MAPPAASLIGSAVRCKVGRAVPKRGRPSFRSAAHQSCVAKRASSHPFDGCVAKGRETCVEPTYTFSCPPQEVGYSASEARKADPRKAANSERRPQSSSRLPCPRSGDACRAGKRKLAVCNTLCAASDPSPGSTFSATRRGDGEGRSRGPGAGTKARGEDLSLRDRRP